MPFGGKKKYRISYPPSMEVILMEMIPVDEDYTICNPKRISIIHNRWSIDIEGALETRMAFGNRNRNKWNFTQWIISMRKEAVPIYEFINESFKCHSFSLLPVGFHAAIRKGLFAKSLPYTILSNTGEVSNTFRLILLSAPRGNNH